MAGFAERRHISKCQQHGLARMEGPRTETTGELAAAILKLREETSLLRAEVARLASLPEAEKARQPQKKTGRLRRIAKEAIGGIVTGAAYVALVLVRVDPNDAMITAVALGGAAKAAVDSYGRSSAKSRYRQFDIQNVAHRFLGLYLQLLTANLMALMPRPNISIIGFNLPSPEFPSLLCPRQAVVLLTQ